MNLKENLILDEERALYGLRHTKISHCSFTGPADGESALKECMDIEVTDCSFNLRYPLWHVKGVIMKDSDMTENCRAPLWYSKNVRIIHSNIKGVKALRECRMINFEDSYIDSAEFCWLCKDIIIKNTSVKGEYPFFQCRNISAEGLHLIGKYSFQYVKNAEIKNSVLDTKDAFWHAENVTVYDSIIKGEYLGWYSKNLRLVRCKIEGTQPLCYAKGLILEDCETTSCDLAFERSSVNASIKGSIDSIKNPLSGTISADYIGDIILDNSVKSRCIIEKAVPDKR